jgi:hypothetical protein
MRRSFAPINEVSVPTRGMASPAVERPDVILADVPSAREDILEVGHALPPVATPVRGRVRHECVLPLTSRRRDRMIYDNCDLDRCRQPRPMMEW